MTLLQALQKMMIIKLGVQGNSSDLGLARIVVEYAQMFREQRNPEHVAQDVYAKLVWAFPAAVANAGPLHIAAYFNRFPERIKRLLLVGAYVKHYE